MSEIKKLFLLEMKLYLFRKVPRNPKMPEEIYQHVIAPKNLRVFLAIHNALRYKLNPFSITMAEINLVVSDENIA
jgi:hypothetical protein